VLSSKTAYSPFPLDAVHTYHYIPDVAAGLAALGCADGSAYGHPWMPPCTSAGTLRELIARLAAARGRAIEVAPVPRWILKTAAVAVPLMRELDEMMYQWDEPFVVDDSRFRTRFQVLPQDVNQAAHQTLQWAQRLNEARIRQRNRTGPAAESRRPSTRLRPELCHDVSIGA
jgi:hypothetical protein